MRSLKKHLLGCRHYLTCDDCTELRVRLITLETTVARVLRISLSATILLTILGFGLLLWWIL